MLGAKLDGTCNVITANPSVNAYTLPTLSSIPAPTTVMQPEGAANRGRFAFAAAALLPKITLNDKTKLSWAILDSGASSHFLLTDAPCVNKKTTSNPISVQIPNGHRVTSSHTAELDIPVLPKKARIAHVLP